MGQRAEIDGRNPDFNRFRKGSNLVLTTTEIDTSLPSYRRINHGKQGGRHVDETNAALIARGYKTAQVGDDATAQVDQNSMTVGMMLHQVFPNSLCSLQGFVLLSWFQHDFHGMSAAQPMLRFGKPKHRHVFIRQDKDLRSFGKCSFQFV